jgi:PhnB protein
MARQLIGIVTQQRALKPKVNIMAVSPIPDGYHSATPYLIAEGAAAAIDFYQQAFGAIERMRLAGPEGKIGHAEIQIGNSFIMLADECPEMGFRGPKSLGGTPVSLMLYVENADAMFGRAVSLGATVVKPIQNQFYGDRSGTITDPFGHVWTIATHVEDVSPEEISARMEAMMKQQPE